MKKSTLILSLGMSVLALSAFTTKKGDHTPKTQSVINWTGSKVVGGSHNGTIQVAENSLKFEDGVLMSGSVVADMTTIKNEDLEGEWNQKLVGHLNSEDFFSTSKFKTATIKINQITKADKPNAYNVKGDLTIKGITNSESFTVLVTPEKANYKVTTTLNVNRTKYNVRYGSSSFFDDLGDNAISDEFILDVTIFVAK